MRYLLHDVLLEGLSISKDAIAVIHESGERYTYQELYERSNQYAAILSHNRDVKQDPFIGIMGPVHFESIAFALGVLKIGGSYVPLDDQSPADRLLAIIENTGLSTIGLFNRQCALYPGLFQTRDTLTLIALDDGEAFHQGTSSVITQKDVSEQTVSEPDFLNQVCDDLAYVLHTSGSTGVPKGIMLSHRNARTFVDWMHKEFQISSSDVIASRAPFKFDLSVFDVFNTLKAGASVLCFDWNQEAQRDNKHTDYVDMLMRENVSVLYTTPSTFITLLNKGGLARCNSLRTCMYAGEPFPVPQLRKLQDALPSIRIANIYGPTETNIITYYWIDSMPEDHEAVPLGAVVDDTEIIVVSEDGSRLCEVDEVGELWCRGGTVTLGYLGLSEKTKACLVESPFHAFPAMFWRTGDFGRCDAQGVLHYHGRRDHMVKVRGFRIELGEIESALAGVKELHQSVIVAVPDERYGNRLHCYYALMPDAVLSAEDLAQRLSEKIPEYMMPYAFHCEELLPETSSGKIDRVLLQKRASLAE